MFDTNVLYTKVASDLVRHDAKRIVQENSNHSDLKIEWYIPDVVIQERKYQMMVKAKELLPAMENLEKLLGHKFGVGEDTLELHVDKAIENSITECGFQIANIDTNNIDWNDLISRSVKRNPPFEANEKEKGFRDSIIAHSFLQLHNSSPSTPNICRLALVSGDQRLTEYISERTTDSKNVRILSNLDELESLINTLVSTIPEEYAAELAKKASALFYEKSNDKTLFNKEQIREKIREQYSKELGDTIIPGGSRSSGNWFISTPIFRRKERQCIHWVTIVSQEFEICHYEADEASLRLANTWFETLNKTPVDIVSSADISKSSKLLYFASLASRTPEQSPLSQPVSQKKILDLKGKEKFEVHWSTNLSQAQKLTSPKLEKIQYLGNNLVEGSS